MRDPAPATKEKSFLFRRIFYFKQMKYYVYIIQSLEGYHYTCMTKELDKRLNEHNDKSLSFWTKRGTNWKLIYKEDFENRQDALRREKWLKTGAVRE
ncbi:MAG: GIY-YIG nuclease family protein [Ignavibacteriales bacterium]|nr:MAG: GIY-YIG nuclease family protein [Ignavibacteriales bacterium]